MCQNEVLGYLARKKASRHNPVDMQELVVHIPANRSSISKNCRKLRERKEVNFVKKKEKSYEKFLYYL